MKNNTKIRLHLSNTLFESIVKEVLAEAKKGDMSGGVYTEMVKAKKEKKDPEMKATDKMKKMEEVDAVGDTEKMRKMHEMSSKEKMAKGLYKEDEMEEMQVNVAEEGQVNEFAEQGQQLITALATLLGIGVPLATSIYRDLKNAKTPEAKKQVMQSLGKSVGDAAGTHLQKAQATPSLNELRKQVKK